MTVKDTPESGEAAGETLWSGDHRDGFAHVGMVLRARRMAQGWDLSQIASALRIRASYLEAIETAQYKQLPGMTYAVGFVRSYADYLGLDGAEMVQRFKQESTGMAQRAALTMPSPAPQGRVPGTGPLLVGLVALTVMGGVWYFWRDDVSNMVTRVAQVPEEMLARTMPATAPEPVTAPPAASPAPPAPPPAPAPAPTPVPAPATPPANGAAKPAPKPAEPPKPEPPKPDVVQVEPPKPEVPRPDPNRAPPPMAAPPVPVSPPQPLPPPVAAGPVPPQPPLPPLARPSQLAPTQRTIVDTAESPDDTPAPPPTALGRAPALSSAPPAEEASPPLQPQSPSAPAQVASSGEGKIYGAQGGDARVVVRAKGESWVQIRDGDGQAIFTRVLRPGDVYRVPARAGLTLMTGNAGAIELVVDGAAQAPLGAAGIVRRNVPLDADKLRNGGN